MTDRELAELLKPYINRLLEKIEKEVIDKTIENTARDTGDLARGWYSQLTWEGYKFNLAFFNNAISKTSGKEYAAYVEKGTGLYGPSPHWIENSKGYVWFLSTGRQVSKAAEAGVRNAYWGMRIFRKKLRGQHPQHMLQRAIDEVTRKYL